MTQVRRRLGSVSAAPPIRMRAVHPLDSRNRARPYRLHRRHAQSKRIPSTGRPVRSFVDPPRTGLRQPQPRSQPARRSRAIATATDRDRCRSRAPRPSSAWPPRALPRQVMSTTVPRRRGRRSRSATMTGSWVASPGIHHASSRSTDVPRQDPQADRGTRQGQGRHADRSGSAAPRCPAFRSRGCRHVSTPLIKRTASYASAKPRCRFRRFRVPDLHPVSHASTTTSLSMPTTSRRRCGIVIRPCPSSFTSSEAPKNSREYARPSLSERGRTLPPRTGVPTRPWGSRTDSRPWPT